jgi:type I restriction enzyme S subunit
VRVQDEIVAEIEKQFSRLDEAVANLKRVKANLKRYKAAILKAAVEGRLVPTEAELTRREGRSYETGAQLLQCVLQARRSQWKGESNYKEPTARDRSDVPDLPEGWAWTSVDCIGDVLLGRQRAPQYLTGRYPRPYLRVANIKDDRIDFSDLEEMDFDKDHFSKYRLQPGDILVSEGQSPELLGQSAIFRGFCQPLCFQKTLHRFRPVAGSVSSEFAQTVFRSHTQCGIFRKLGSITTNIAHLTLEKFKAAPFPLPPLAEQRRIVAEVDRRLSLVREVGAEVDANLKRAERLRQSVLARHFGQGMRCA